MNFQKQNYILLATLALTACNSGNTTTKGFANASTSGNTQNIIEVNQTVSPYILHLGKDKTLTYNLDESSGKVTYIQLNQQNIATETANILLESAIKAGIVTAVSNWEELPSPQGTEGKNRGYCYGFTSLMMRDWLREIESQDRFKVHFNQIFRSKITEDRFQQFIRYDELATNTQEQIKYTAEQQNYVLFPRTPMTKEGIGYNIDTIVSGGAFFYEELIRDIKEMKPGVSLIALSPPGHATAMRVTKNNKEITLDLYDPDSYLWSKDIPGAIGTVSFKQNESITESDLSSFFEKSMSPAWFKVLKQEEAILEYRTYYYSIESKEQNKSEGKDIISKKDAFKVLTSIDFRKLLRFNPKFAEKIEGFISESSLENFINDNDGDNSDKANFNRATKIDRLVEYYIVTLASSNQKTKAIDNLKLINHLFPNLLGKETTYKESGEEKSITPIKRISNFLVSAGLENNKDLYKFLAETFPDLNLNPDLSFYELAHESLVQLKDKGLITSNNIESYGVFLEHALNARAILNGAQWRIQTDAKTPCNFLNKDSNDPAIWDNNIITKSLNLSASQTVISKLIASLLDSDNNSLCKNAYNQLPAYFYDYEDNNEKKYYGLIYFIQELVPNSFATIIEESLSGKLL